MKYKLKASQTIYKIIEVEANNEDEAEEIAQNHIDEGEIRFDDEPWLDMEVSLQKL